MCPSIPEGTWSPLNFNFPMLFILAAYQVIHISMCWCFYVIKSMILDKSYLIVVLTERLVPTTRLQFLASRNSCRSLIATTTTIHYCPVLTTKTDYYRLPLWCYKMLQLLPTNSCRPLIYSSLNFGRVTTKEYPKEQYINI